MKKKRYIILAVLLITAGLFFAKNKGEYKLGNLKLDYWLEVAKYTDSNPGITYGKTNDSVYSDGCERIIIPRLDKIKIGKKSDFMFYPGQMTADMDVYNVRLIKGSGTGITAYTFYFTDDFRYIAIEKSNIFPAANRALEMYNITGAETIKEFLCSVC